MNEDICYVYQHIDPITKDVLYVGQGTGQRAWMCLGGYKKAKYGHRCPEHRARLEELMREGFLPSDWVIISNRCLPRGEACRIEQSLIRELCPKFNRPLGKKLMKVTKESFKIMRELKDSGLSYKKIGEKFNIAAMTVYRALNGKTKNAECFQ